MATKRIRYKLQSHTDKVKLYDGHSLFSSVVDHLRNGGTVVLLEKRGSYCKVTGNCIGTGKLKTGWIKTKHLSSDPVEN